MTFVLPENLVLSFGYLCRNKYVDMCLKGICYVIY